MFGIIAKNVYGEDKEIFLNLEDVVIVEELHQEPTRLYNEDGDLVEEKQPTEKLYRIVLVLKNGHHTCYNVSETEFAKLKKQLVKQAV